MNENLTLSLIRRLSVLDLLRRTEYYDVKHLTPMSKDEFDKVMGWLIARLAKEIIIHADTLEFDACFKEGACFYKKQFLSQEMLSVTSAITDYIDDKKNG